MIGKQAVPKQTEKTKLLTPVSNEIREDKTQDVVQIRKQTTQGFANLRYTSRSPVIPKPCLRAGICIKVPM